MFPFLSGKVKSGAASPTRGPLAVATAVMVGSSVGGTDVGVAVGTSNTDVGVDTSNTGVGVLPPHATRNNMINVAAMTNCRTCWRLIFELLSLRLPSPPMPLFESKRMLLS